MRYIDVVKVSGRGETVKLSKNEYKELTSHKKVGTKKRRTIKHSYRRKKAIPLTNAEREILYHDMVSFLKNKLLTRVFTVINILENVNVATAGMHTNNSTSSSTDPQQQPQMVIRQEPHAGLGLGRSVQYPNGQIQNVQDKTFNSYWEYNTVKDPSANECNYLIVDGEKRRMKDGK